VSHLSAVEVISEKKIMTSEQGDQMRLLKNRPKYGTTHFLSKLVQTFNRQKSSPQIWATSSIF
jgi:hypothetical protein